MNVFSTCITKIGNLSLSVRNGQASIILHTGDQFIQLTPGEAGWLSTELANAEQAMMQEEQEA